MEPHARFRLPANNVLSPPKCSRSHILSAGQGGRVCLELASMQGKGAEVVAAAEAAIAAAETRVAPLRDPTLYITHSMDIADKVGELEERARRLAREEVEEIRRGRELNIITGTTPVNPTK